MRKNFTIILFLISLIICLTTISDNSAQSISEDEGVESVNLEMDEIFFCPRSHSTTGACSNKHTIEVSAFSEIAEKEGLNYYYFVDGGKIIGEGAKVTWDFWGTRPGKYSITVGVGKNSIIKGKTITKTVLNGKCEDCGLVCSCPFISIFGPTVIANAGDTLIFTAKLFGGSQDRANFNWTVSDGEIIKTIQSENQSQILVKTSNKTKAKEIMVTVEVNGLCSDCTQRTASATVKIK